MRKVALPWLLMAMSLPMFAQTTYTVAADGCGGKANQYCQLPLADGSQLTIDTRIASSGPIDTLTISSGVYPNQTTTVYVHGTYSGFVANPDGTRNSFSSTAGFRSDDGTVIGTFNYYAHYVSVCSGRGCGGTLGWHYAILAGSTVEVQ